MHRFLILAATAAILLVEPTMAQAYIGPGLGAGVISAVLGFVAAVAMAFVAVVWYPVKRLFKKRKPASGPATEPKAPV